MLPSISHLTDELVLLPVPKRSRRASSASVYTLSLPSGNERTPKDALRSLYLSLKPPLTETAVTDAIQFLQQQELSHGSYSSHIVSVDAEERSIYGAIVGKLAAAVYARTLDIFLREAGDAETEAEWWADIERSRSRAAYYLLQTFPSRMVNLVLDVKHALRSQQRNFDISMLSTSSLAQILTREGDSDNTIAASIFPHLRTHPYGIPFPPALLQFPALSIRSTPRILDHCRSAVFDFLSSISAIITFPVELARQECTFKRKELQKIRDERAEILGTLTLRREYLFGALREGEIKGSRLNSFIENINQLIVGQSYERLPADVEPSQLLATTVHVALPSHITSHQRSLQEHDLTRPGQIALLWPRLVLLPPLVLFSVHRMLASKDTLQTFAYDGADTIKRFCHGWLVEPLKDIIRTVRAGHERGVIVQKESIDADLKSLERMAVDLARDKLHYDEEQLVSFSHSIRKGDLTPILEIYEADIKNPVKSAISGTLLRSLFIQIQKAKVDIDHTLTGIDKLLKSQELTFAFVGVAPALAIVYIAGGVLAGLWRGGKGRGRYGSKRQRAAAWLAIRRTERLLVSKPTSEDYLSSKGSTIPPLTSGLLLLSVSSLRTYGERNLPQHSRLREGFLEDVGDLEDPSLDRDEKVKVVERMWRSWGDTLGWRRGGGSIVIA